MRFLVAMILVVASQSLPFFVSTNLTLSSRSGDYYLLRLQKCTAADVWTIHGLWLQSREGCGGSFNVNAIQDLVSTMGDEWLSCPQYHSNNEAFWSHEWSEHGSCTGLAEHSFFSTALSLYESHASDCSSSNGEDQCSICFDAQFRPCGSVGSTSCSC